LAAAVASAAVSWRSTFISQIRGAIAGGVDVVQIRERGLEDRELVDLVRECVELAAGTSTRIVVNDRIDVAWAAGAHGVHLPEDSVGIEHARQIGGRGWLIGRSIHTVQSARRAQSADYLIAGSVFETASKPGTPVSLGVDGLRDVVLAAGECPVWAVGGVTPDRVGQILECGAQGVAAIGAFIPMGQSTEVAEQSERLTRQLRFSLTVAAGLL
jgi:thiamine-phosphate pyrophosphorylase